ncbi:Maf family protein [Aliamphritea hakodatensis]|uniref:Maf family protein n=1 Tax=Aliamphritea hakodatensis TaxID=2895352 RepID=UPI0022FD4483|nr:Maf family protein [Aliamphritea hakodatensis]
MSDLILASASPRRRELLQQIGVRFDVQPVDIPEVKRPDESADDFVKRLAVEKATAGWERSGRNLPVLGSDTVVVLDDQVMGKPRNREHGIAMLQALSGREHQVMTALAIVNNEQTQVRAVSTRVQFKELSDELCLRYWETGEPADKAGGYGIQGLGAVFVASMSGSYSSVVGLPLAETADLLNVFKVPFWQCAAE